FGFALVAIFIGAISIYSFLWTYIAIFDYSGSPNSYIGVIKLTLAVLDNIKLLISVAGFVTAAVIFFKYVKN
ncbi:MAG: hypothetical protein ACTSVE_12635, partial [Candidatus Helarchaeota archaeon]